MPGIKNSTYNGFYAGHSGSSEGGWMLWSGSFFFSNSAGTRTDYTGVGIEAIGSSESYLRFSSSNGGNLDVRANKFFIGNPNLQFISGSASDIEISGSGFHIRPLSNSETEITASAGKIGNWIIKDGKLSGSNATLDATGAALYMTGKGPDTDSSAAFDILRDEYYIDFTPADQGNTTNYYVKFGPNFAVDHSGTLHASGAVFEGTITSSIGLIGGWHIGTTALSSSNLILDSTGEIRTMDFTSSLIPGNAGRGWRIRSSGEAEFENAQIRGTLNTAVFEKQSVNVVGGQLLVSNGTTITGSSLILAGTTTIPVKNATGFVNNEYIIAKATGSSGFTTETMKITGVDTSANPNTITVSRGQGSGGTIPTMSAGQVLASTGASQSGYIHMNAAPSDAATPYIDIIERTGSNAESTKRRARLGDLSGIAGEGPVPASPGFGLYSENVYLSGTITASAGRIAGWDINGSQLKAGVNINLDANNKRISINDTTFGNTGIQLQYNSGTPRAHIGSTTRYLQFDGTDLIVTSSGLAVDTDGFVTATNISEKMVTITAANDHLYYQSATIGGATRTRLVCDGTLGGEIAMNFQINIAPPTPLGDIKLPNQGSDSKQEIELSINCSGVEFDNDDIAPEQSDMTRT